MSNETFRDNEHYVGEVVGHDFRKSTYNGVTKPQLVLSVKVKGRAKKKYEADAYVPYAEEDQQEKVLYFDLDPAGQKLDRVMGELKSLGFAHTDPKLLAKLHPAHPKHLSFLGRDVLVRVWTRDKLNDAGAVVGTKESWFLVVPKAHEEFDFAEFEKIAAENGESYQNALARAGSEE